MRGDRFVATVIDVNDPEKSGRVKVRILGMHDDKSRVPDDMLPWARCVFPVTNPIHKGVAGPTTGLIAGSTVVGFFADDHDNIPIIEGVIGGTTENGSDFPKSNNGEDHNEVLEDNIFHIGSSEIRFALDKTIGNIEYIGQDIGNLMTQIGEGDIRGAINAAKDTLNAFQQLKTQVLDAPVEMLNSVIAGFQSDLGSIIDDEIEDIVTGDLGQVIDTTGSVADTVSDIAGTVGGSKLKDQVQSVTGVIFSNSTQAASAISTRVSKKMVTNATEALNRLNGHKFVMNHQMKGIEQSLGSLKSAMKRVKTSVERK